MVVTGDNRHTVHIYHWKSKTLIYKNVGHNGTPPAVFGAVWNNFTLEQAPDGSSVCAPRMFVTYGAKHLKVCSHVCVCVGGWGSVSLRHISGCLQFCYVLDLNCR